MTKTYCKNYENENRVIIKKVSYESKNAVKLTTITVDTTTGSVVSVQNDIVEIAFEYACAILDNKRVL